MSEHEQQKILVRWARDNVHKHPSLKWLYAITNGTHRGVGKKGAISTARLKAEGMLNGVADICLPVARIVNGMRHHGLYIEMKDGKKDATTEQDAFLKGVWLEGYEAIVCESGVEAVEVLKTYIQGERWAG